MSCGTVVVNIPKSDFQNANMLLPNGNWAVEGFMMDNDSVRSMMTPNGNWAVEGYDSMGYGSTKSSNKIVMWVSLAILVLLLIFIVLYVLKKKGRGKIRMSSFTKL